MVEATNINMLSCALLPASLQWLKQYAPAFPIHSYKISVITEPVLFYKELKQQISTASRRVSLASLYLGSGELEQDLVRCMGERLKEAPQLRVQWLLDYTRGSRGPHSSRDTLLPLLGAQHDTACQVALFHTPELRGLLKRVLPQRWNEVVALQHMKLYVFDDTVLISGANLSNDYFTNRQDRYLLVRDVPELANFFHDVVSCVAEHSLTLAADNTTHLHPRARNHPFLGNYKKYCEEVETSITSIWEREMKNSERRLQQMNKILETGNTPGVHADHEAALPSTQPSLRLDVSSASYDGSTAAPTYRQQRAMHSDHSDTPEDTIIFPTLQMKSFNINYDSILTKKVLSSILVGNTVHLASGYFNLTKDYMNCILHDTKATWNILCAHPTANGFMGARGAAGSIPSAYTLLARQFLNRVWSQEGGAERVKVREYQRPGWTFHGKGLWYTPSAAKKIAVTLIGSPNFGWRSVERDLESQVVVVTSSERLSAALAAERARLYDTSVLVQPSTFTQPSRQVPLWIKWIMPFIKKAF